MEKKDAKKVKRSESRRMACQCAPSSGESRDFHISSVQATYRKAAFIFKTQIMRFD